MTLNFALIYVLIKTKDYYILKYSEGMNIAVSFSPFSFSLRIMKEKGSANY